MSAVAERTVQTSEQAEPRADAALEFTGRVAHRGHVAVQPFDREGHVRPVVVVDLDHVGPANQRLQANLLCETHEAAEALANSLKRGDTVTVRCPLSDIRLHLGAASLSTTKKE